MFDQLLALVILVNIGLLIWFATTSKVTPEERDEMLQDEEMFP